ncbi:MAG TPA: family 10 glycosylhydrolase, partial [Chthonomonadaceae bacterium]|nr:family 10 glycosylhydrolase [Chthonomonadaceae bacterium]
VSACALAACPASAQEAAPQRDAARPPIAQETPTAPPSDPSALASNATGEMRGMWVVRDSLASPQSVHRVIVTATKYHINTLFVQVRGRGDAWYNSPYEPRAEKLRRQPASFDPLEQMVREAHASGLKVHAWMNTFLTWSGAKAPFSPQHLWNAHRDWFACDRHGRCSPIGNDRCEGAFLQPSNPGVQEHLLRVFTDVATRYDVDGIHFDYCRYAGSDFDFSGSTLRRFRDAMAERLSPEEVARFDCRLKSDRLAYVHAFGREWGEWRRGQVTAIVASISKAVKTAKPYVQVSAAVFPDANEAYAVRGQDWRGWLTAGYLDAVALMAYDRNTDRVIRQTREAVAIAGEKHVYTGVGAWRLAAADVAHKIAEIRKTGAAGINLFSYDGMHTRANYLDTLARGVFASRSAPRAMRWLPPRAPAEPRKPKTDKDGK